VVSFVVYFLEVTLSTFMLGVALGFASVRVGWHRCGSLSAVPSVQLRIRPPGLARDHSASTATRWRSSNLLLTSFVKIGADAGARRRLPRRLALNWLLATSILVLVLHDRSAAPFYNAGMLIGPFCSPASFSCRRLPASRCCGG
jgi:hypothetical protein